MVYAYLGMVSLLNWIYKMANTSVYEMVGQYTFKCIARSVPFYAYT